MKALLVTTAALALITACLPMPFSGECSEDGQCEEGLSCMESVASSSSTDDSCTVSEHKICTRSCTDDSDCADLEDGSCEDTCTEGERICMRRATSDLELGWRCEESSECVDGLSCIQGPMVSGENTCSMVCSIECTDDSDCASLGSNALCFEGCPGQPRVCMATD